MSLRLQLARNLESKQTVRAPSAQHIRTFRTAFPYALDKLLRNALQRFRVPQLFKQRHSQTQTMKFAQLAQALRKRTERWIASKKEEGKLASALLRKLPLRGAISTVFADKLCLAPYGRSLQQGSKRQLHAHGILDPCQQPRRQQGMPAQVEKVVIAPYRFCVEYRFPNRDQLFFSGAFGS